VISGPAGEDEHAVDLFHFLIAEANSVEPLSVRSEVTNIEIDGGLRRDQIFAESLAQNQRLLVDLFEEEVFVACLVDLVGIGGEGDGMAVSLETIESEKADSILGNLGDLALIETDDFVRILSDRSAVRSQETLALSETDSEGNSSSWPSLSGYNSILPGRQP